MTHTTEGAASFKVQAGSALPSGWGFAAEVVSAHEGECVETNYCGKVGYDMIGGKDWNSRQCIFPFLFSFLSSSSLLLSFCPTFFN